MDDFAQLVKQRRKQRGLSSRELSRLLNKSSAYVSELERGVVKRPSYDVAKQLAEILDIDESLLSHFGYVPPEVEAAFQRSVEAELAHRQQMERVYVANLTEEIARLDLDSLESLSYALQDGSDLVWMLYTLHRMGERQALVTIGDFVRFMVAKVEQ